VFEEKENKDGQSKLQTSVRLWIQTKGRYML